MVPRVGCLAKGSAAIRSVIAMMRLARFLGWAFAALRDAVVYRTAYTINYAETDYYVKKRKFKLS